MIHDSLFLFCFFFTSGLFEVRVQEYLDSIHENEHRRVNRFLKGLGKVCFWVILCQNIFKQSTVGLFSPWTPSVSFALLQETRWNFSPRNNRTVTPQKEAKSWRQEAREEGKVFMDCGGKKLSSRALSQRRSFTPASSVSVFQTVGFCSRTRDSSNRCSQEKSCCVSHETETEDYTELFLVPFKSVLFRRKQKTTKNKIGPCKLRAKILSILMCAVCSVIWFHKGAVVCLFWLHDLGSDSDRPEMTQTCFPALKFFSFLVVRTVTASQASDSVTIK